MLLTLYTKTVQLYYPFEMLLNNKLNTISSLPGTYVKCVLLKDVLLFKCLAIDLIAQPHLIKMTCLLMLCVSSLFRGSRVNLWLFFMGFNATSLFSLILSIKPIKWPLIGWKNTKERRKHTT